MPEHVSCVQGIKQQEHFHYPEEYVNYRFVPPTTDSSHLYPLIYTHFKSLETGCVPDDLKHAMVPILFSNLNSLCFPCVFPVTFIFFPEQTGEE